MDKLGLLAKLLDQVGGRRVNKLARWSGLLAFNYHRIGDPATSPYDRALYSATEDGFAAQLAFLASNFDVIGLDDLAGLSDRPGRHVLITFDDGYRDNYELAFPILRAQKLPAAFFITVGFLDQRGMAWWDEIAWMVRRSTRATLPAGEWLTAPLSIAPPNREAAIYQLLLVYKAQRDRRGDELVEWIGAATGSGRATPAESSATWMTWDMVRAMRAGGMAIGGHTVNHPVLARLAPAAQAAEISGAGARIQAELGEPMRWFAYPVGGRDAFDDHTRHALAQAGVEHAFSYYGGYQRPGEWDRYDLRRVSVESDIDGPRFRAMATLPSLYATSGDWLPRIRATARDQLGRR